MANRSTTSLLALLVSDGDDEDAQPSSGEGADGDDGSENTSISCIDLEEELDTLRPDAPLEPYLIAATKLIAMSTARNPPLTKKSIDEDSGGETGEGWVRSKMEFEAGNNAGKADGGVKFTLEEEANAKWGLDAALGFPGDAATQGGDDTAENLNGATDHLHATPTSVADIDVRIDKEEALQLLTNKSRQPRQLQLYNRLT